MEAGCRKLESIALAVFLGLDGIPLSAFRDRGPCVFCNLTVGGPFTVEAGTRSLNKKNEKGNNETKGEKVKMG